MRPWNLSENEAGGWEDEDKAEQADVQAKLKGKFLVADQAATPCVVHVRDGVALTAIGARLLELSK